MIYDLAGSKGSAQNENGNHEDCNLSYRDLSKNLQSSNNSEENSLTDVQIDINKNESITQAAGAPTHNQNRMPNGASSTGDQ